MPDDSGILIRRGGDSGAWTTPETTAYEAEAHLQQVLAATPGRVPGVSDEACSVRELATTAGYVDVCIVDIDRRLTIVECKLASNSERRRMVIGQVIDYAAALWRDGEVSFFDAWRRVDGVELADALSPSAFSKLRQNLVAGRMNLCLAVDTIDGNLRRLVEYLNLITLPEVSVTAVQLSYARDGDVEILIPTSFGGEIAEAKVAPSGRRVRWTKDSFLEAVVSDTDRATAAWLFAQAEALEPRRGPNEPLWYGTKPGGGIFLQPYGLEYSPLQLWVNKAGQLMAYGNWAQFAATKGHPGFAELAALLGQDHRAGQRGVAASTLDRHRLWDIALRCSEAINEPRPASHDGP